MLSEVQRAKYLKSYAEIEASFRIEGMDPSGDPLYESAKASVQAGEITPEQALEALIDATRAEQRQPALTAK